MSGLRAAYARSRNFAFEVSSARARLEASSLGAAAQGRAGTVLGSPEPHPLLLTNDAISATGASSSSILSTPSCVRIFLLGHREDPKPAPCLHHIGSGAQRKSFSATAEATSSSLGNTQGPASAELLDPLSELQKQRREYKVQISELRKQYAQEHAERLREKDRAAKEKRELMKRAQASQSEARKEEAAARRVLYEQQQGLLRAEKEAQRERNQEWRRQVELRQRQRRDWEGQKLRAASRFWVKQEDVEQKIQNALAHPFVLF